MLYVTIWCSDEQSDLTVSQLREQTKNLYNVGCIACYSEKAIPCKNFIFFFLPFFEGQFACEKAIVAVILLLMKTLILRLLEITSR